MAAQFSLAKEASSGFSNASNYDKYRSSYTAESASKLLTKLSVAGQKNARIIELASGTGKFTELLVARPEQFEVLAIEPHDGMRDVLAKKNLGIKVLSGEASNIPASDGWADALIAAQAFHWFPTDEALKEMNRVLRPGAALGLIWNIDDYNGPKTWPTTTKWEQKLKDIIAENEDGHNRFRHMKWKDVFENQQDSTPLQTLRDTFTHNLPNFSLPLGEETIKWTTWLPDEVIWLRFSTLSHIANLYETKREEIRRKILDALKGDDVERNEKGEIAMHVVTYMAWTSRI